jgi:hypothetical protein
MVREKLNPEPVYITSESGAKKFHHWRLPITPDSEKRLRDLLDNEIFSIDESALSIFEVNREWGNENERIAESTFEDGTLHNDLINGSVTPYQAARIRYTLRNFKGVIINDPENMDRIKQAITSAESSGDLPVIIVHAKIDRFNWYSTLKKILNKRSIRIIKTKGDLNGEDSADYTLISYDLLTTHEDYINSLEWKCIIFDKCENLRNEKTDWTKAAQRIASQINHRVALSGFNLVNEPVDLISIMKVIDRLEDFGGFWYFANNYCDAKKTIHGWDLSGKSNQGDLIKNLKRLCYIRRI